MMDDFFSIMLIIAGFFILYSAKRLKTEHFIVKTVMAPPKDGPDKPRDIEGYVKYMFPRVFALAVVTIILGVYLLTQKYMPGMSGTLWTSILELVMYAVFFACLIYYIRCVKKAGNLFY